MGVTRAVAVLGIVSLLALFLTQWSGGTYTAAPSSIGSDPFAGLPAWPTFVPPQSGTGTECSYWDLLCKGGQAASYAAAYMGAAVSYIGELFVRVLGTIFAFLQWFFGQLMSIASTVWGILNAPLVFFTGNWIYLGVMLMLPLWASVALALLRIVRGSGG